MTRTGTRDGERTALLAARDVCKRYGAVEALRSVDLELVPGEVTAVVGDNGAGKSTLASILAGVISPDSGTIYWDGHAVQWRGARESAARGIAVVYQDLALCDNLDVVQNIFLGREPVQRGRVFLAERHMARQARELIEGLKITTIRSLRAPVGSLSGGQRQAIAIAKSVITAARLIVLDEPTAALGVAETAHVLELIKELRERELSVVVISHNLRDVFEVADRIVVLRLGQVVADILAEQVNEQDVVQLITTGRMTEKEVK